MQPRFVIVPAVPVEQEPFRQGVRHCASTISGGFDIYDNQEKLRLKRSYPSKSLAEAACAKMIQESRNPAELFPLLRAYDA